MYRLQKLYFNSLHSSLILFFKQINAIQIFKNNKRKKPKIVSKFFVLKLSRNFNSFKTFFYKTFYTFLLIINGSVKNCLYPRIIIITFKIKSAFLVPQSLILKIRLSYISSETKARKGRWGKLRKLFRIFLSEFHLLTSLFQIREKTSAHFFENKSQAAVSKFILEIKT